MTAVLLMLSLTAACAVRRAPDGPAQQPACAAAETTAGTESGQVAWVKRTHPGERSALDAWCSAVGPAVWSDHRAASSSAAADSVAVIAWNGEVGHGRLRNLIADLRSGTLTGAPARHFVLLLQEAHRTGVAVPAKPPEWAAVARGVGDARDTTRQDVIEVARDEQLALLYAPSMRNGPAGGRSEDRGNAILSTLPLRDAVVLELPYERQRRVAVIASVDVLDAAGRPVTLRVASVHLDNRARFGRIHRTFGDARLNQARAVADFLADGPATIVGGDLNTWVPGADEAAVDALRAALPLPAVSPRQGTLQLPLLLTRLRVDHMFFRLPAGWDAGYRVGASTYGSDHHPLVGWIRALQRSTSTIASPSGTCFMETELMQ